jgi:hypothetical protein
MAQKDFVILELETITMDANFDVNTMNGVIFQRVSWIGSHTFIVTIYFMHWWMRFVREVTS